MDIRQLNNINDPEYYGIKTSITTKEEPKKSLEDKVNHPSHYCTGNIETIDYIQDKLGEGYKYYLEGNILKYISRYRHKNGAEDLKKAEFYLKRLIEIQN